MPNICLAFITVRGRASCVDEFIAILQSDYNYNRDSRNGDYSWCPDPKNITHVPHFFRVFDAYLFDDPVYHSAVYKCVTINIECAWSVYSCIFPGEHTYYNDFERDHHGEHFGSNILIESKRLQLELEIWSYESGMCFQEHYKICSGVLIKDETFGFDVLWLEDYSNYNELKEKFKDDSRLLISEEEFNERIQYKDYWYEYGLQEEITDFSPTDPPKYLANLVMVKPRKE
jgi:hypothetical protein